MQPTPPSDPGASKGPFELDPVPPGPPRSGSAASPPVASAPSSASGDAAALAARAVSGPVDAEGRERTPDERTFAEKHGEAVARVAGVRDYPAGWPREALLYPLRGAGVALLLGSGAVLFALDLLGWPSGLRFLSWLAKTPVLLFVVRWQLDLAGMSAGGHDRPVGWTRALALDRGDLGVYVRFLVWAAALVLPSAVVWLLGPSMLEVWPDSGWIAWGLLVLASAWLALVALSTAVQDARLKRPWVTVLWLALRPLPCLVGSLGWWALGATEVLIGRLADSGSSLAMPGAITLRVASVYAVMLSARVLGVLGRRVDPARLRPA